MPDVYIDTDVASGGTGTSGDPYSTWDEAWEAEDANISGGETWNFFFTGTAADSDPVVIDGLPAGDVTINFYAWHTEFGATSDAADGWVGDSTTDWSTSHYRHVRGDGTTTAGEAGIKLNDTTTQTNVFRFQGLQIAYDESHFGRRGLDIVDCGANATVHVIGNRFGDFPGTGDFPRALRVNTNVQAEFHIKNNLITYAGTEEFSAININSTVGGQGDFFVYNNTIIYTGASGQEDAFDDASANNTSTIKNNVTYANGGAANIEFDTASGTTTKDYNASQTSGDRGSNGYDVATGDFNNYASADYSPAASQTNAWGTNGETNADDSEVPTDDIRGKDRNTASGAATAIGCFADSSEGSTTGTASQTVTLPTQSVAGTMQPSGTASQTTETPSQAVAGGQEFTGTSAQTAPAPTQDAAGSHVNGVSGSAAQEAIEPTQAASGTHTISVSGSMSQAAIQPTQTASGGQAFTGTLSQLLPAPSQIASGFGAFLGAASQLIPSLGQLASGVEIFSGTIGQSAAQPTQLLAGSQTADVSGTISQIVPSPSQLVAGARAGTQTSVSLGTAIISGSITLGGATLSGAVSLGNAKI